MLIKSLLQIRKFFFITFLLISLNGCTHLLNNNSKKKKFYLILQL
ncbi:hypothetical protein RJU59_01295 [Buchnera aphidicola (Kurisakia onigurumii)]